MIESFHAREFGIDPPIVGKPSPLESITYHESLDDNDTHRCYNIAQNVAETLIHYPWTKIFGLNYTETMQLPYSQWDLLRHLIAKYYPPKLAAEHDDDLL